jgi:hypothetical protein
MWLHSLLWLCPNGGLPSNGGYSAGLIAKPATRVPLAMRNRMSNNKKPVFRGLLIIVAFNGQTLIMNYAHVASLIIVALS